MTKKAIGMKLEIQWKIFPLRTCTLFVKPTIDCEYWRVSMSTMRISTVICKLSPSPCKCIFFCRKILTWYTFQKYSTKKSIKNALLFVFFFFCFFFPLFFFLFDFFYIFVFSVFEWRYIRGILKFTTWQWNFIYNQAKWKTENGNECTGWRYK